MTNSPPWSALPGRPPPKVLSEFADRGLVRLGRGRIILLDVDGLAAEAGD